MKILRGALLLAIVWTMALALIQRSIGLHSTPGMWAGALGLPGVVTANLLQPYIHFDPILTYCIMFLVNWLFYFTVIHGVLSAKTIFTAELH